jgi:hypothetical protein
MDRYALIVDAYHIPFGDSRGFASAFRDRGILPVAVMSTPEPMPAFLKRWFPEDFEAIHYFDGDFEALTTTLKNYDPICIVPGLEPGVELAGRLVDALLPGTGNLPGSSPIHRDKSLMAKSLEKEGVPHLRTICSHDGDAVAEWIRSSGLEGEPLVIKPPKSSGAEDVVLIEAGGDWRAYFEQLLGTKNHYGMVNEDVIVQEFAEGTEYIVDLYSVDGEHGLVDVCEYRKHNKNGQIGIYDVADFVHPGDPVVEELAEYTKIAAHACGIRNGSTHAEVMLTPKGPRLIELAARYSGSCMMISGSLATGDNQIDRTVRHYVDGEFLPSFEIVKECRTLWLAANQDGILRNIELLDAAKDLPTFFAMSVPENGTKVPYTTGMSTSLGWIIQSGPDWESIEADYAIIRKLESQLVIEPTEAG